MRTWLLTSAVVICAAAGPAAQDPPPPDAPDERPAAGPAHATADAVQAMLRADYARAVELLEPLVANWPYANPAAAFFLGLLYENGLGVPQDPTRACALFARGTFGQPFTRTAEELTRAHLPTAPDCGLLMNRALRNGFAPARFTLGAEHWVAIDVSPRRQEIVAIVGYQGQEKESAFSYGPMMGAIFLPTIYTSLPGPGEGAPARHFIEVAHWLPVSASRWDLRWALAEIAGPEIVEAAAAVLTTIETDLPPFDVSVELRDLVTLESTEAGGVEIVIPNGSDAAREGVPTFAERKEIADEASRRKAADEKVNWKRRRDPGRPPSFSYGDADGCSDLFVFGWSSGRAEAIAIRADRQMLELGTAPRTFDLAVPQAEIEVTADVYDRPQRRWSFCTDVNTIEDGARQETWRAVGGTVTIQVSQGVRSGNPQQYRATVQIDNAEFVNAAGQTVRSLQPIRLTAVAGPVGSTAP